MKATPVRATVFAAGFVIVNVMTDVPLTVIRFAPNDLLIVGGATTATVFKEVLLPSFVSVITPPGSTVAVLGRVPAEVGVTAKVTLNEAPAGSVTAPFAAQLRAVPVMEQLIVPVGAVPPGVTVNAPCG